jgi:hypothetical protein
MTDGGLLDDWWETRQAKRDRAAAVRKRRMPPMPPGSKPSGTCQWCAGAIVFPEGHKQVGQPNLRRSWHPECVGWQKVAANSGDQRWAVWQRDHGRCALCCVVHPETSLVGWAPYGTKDRPQISRISWKRQYDGFYVRATDWAEYCPIQSVMRSAWQADHIVPLWSIVAGDMGQRGCFFGMANLWTLCTGCHRTKTARESGTRTLRRHRRVAA